MLISICIPSLNRASYLLESLDSIFSWEQSKDFFEICISNNRSEESYAAIENLIATKIAVGWKIKYIQQKKRVDIDRHMHVVVKMASSNYCFLLGDDDFFITEDLPRLIDLVKKSQPDLAIFNAKLVDKNSDAIGWHFAIKPIVFSSVEDAFLNLRDKGTFGSILVKKELLADTYFECLYGTSHAYGCYWISILNDRFDDAIITVPEFPCVGLRMADKSYNRTVVYYRDVIFEIAVYKRWLNSGRPQFLNEIFTKKIYRMITSTRFIISLIANGVSANDIYQINPSIFNSNSFRMNFLLSKLLLNSGVYFLLKFLINQIKKYKNENFNR